MFEQAFRSYEPSSSADGMEHTGIATNFDVSSYFDEFADTADFLSDVDIRALLSSSFQSTCG